MIANMRILDIRLLCPCKLALHRMSMSTMPYNTNPCHVRAPPEAEAKEEQEESEPTTSSDDEVATPTQETKDSLKWWWVPCEEEEEMEEGRKIWKAYRGCMVRD